MAIFSFTLASTHDQHYCKITLWWQATNGITHEVSITASVEGQLAVMFCVRMVLRRFSRHSAVGLILLAY